MTRLSVNINKVALIRNARGTNHPDLIQFARDCEKYGAEGITVHPRPDERHIRYSDIPLLKEAVSTELNIEGNPTRDFIEMVISTQPHQVTLVPDDPNQLTSDHGWDTVKHKSFLQEVISEFQKAGIRTSIFVDPDTASIEGAKTVGTDCIELYTEPYASAYPKNPESAIADYTEAAQIAKDLGLIINAGHDLNLKNLKFFKENLCQLDEVSIGHALVVDALYMGIQNSIQMYKHQLA